jgi:hypothetical protein
MNVRSAEGEGIMNQSGINHHPTFSAIQQISQVVQMTVASADSVPGAVLIENEDLTWREPSLFV